MSMLDATTPLVLTFNEAPNIRRTLARLDWARDIVVVDSGSTDATLAILAEFPRVRVFHHAYASNAGQWTFALTQTGIASEWVLALDADYVLSEELVREITALQPVPAVSGYRVAFVYCVHGRPLRGSAYPPVVVLYRRSAARYIQDGHTQRVQIEGAVEPLSGCIFHDDRKPLSAWFRAQRRYMALEAEKLLGTSFTRLSAPDRLRRLIVAAPPAMLLFCLFVRGNVLDGPAGWFYALQRTAAELLLSFYLVRRMLGQGR
jgi:glycosyltransferase involved in cell wall biosynthesis